MPRERRLIYALINNDDRAKWEYCRDWGPLPYLTILERRLARPEGCMTADHLGFFTLMTGFIIWTTSWLVHMWKPETWKVMSCVSPVGGSLILVGTIIAIADFVVRTHQ
jgi:hypothetical protein